MKNRLVNEGAKRLDLATQHVSIVDSEYVYDYNIID